MQIRIFVLITLTFNMRSLFCRINFNQQAVDTKNFEHSVCELTQYDKISKDILISKNTAFGHVDFHTKETRIYSDDSFVVLSDSRLDDTIEASNSKINSTDELLIKSYEKWGVDCPNYLLGDFAFLIWDKSSQEIFCARDHFGVKPLYYYFDDKTIIISSEIKAIISQSDLSFSVNEQYLADTLSIIKSEHDQTIYNEIKKLPPAHSLHLKNNRLVIKKYWKLTTQKIREDSDEEIIRQFKELVFKSVQNRIQSVQNVGSELSGGLDSSSIAAVASKFINIKSFSHILPDEYLGKIHPFKDEREFIKQVNDFCKIKESHLVTSETPGIFDVLDNHITDSKHITQQSFGVFSDQLYSKAEKENISVLLSGFGGDEVITSKSGNYLEELVRIGKWDELKTDLKESNNGNYQYYKSLLKCILKFKFTAIYNILLWLKTDKVWWKEKFQHLALNNEFSDRMNIQTQYYKYYSRINPNLFQERNIEKITHPHVAQRLEYCNTTTRNYGIEYRYPFLDKRLIGFYLSLPPRLKARNGIKRYAIREAMKNMLPENIRLRNDKTGATIPTVQMRLLKDKQKIGDLIQKSKTNTPISKYIDIEKFESWYQDKVSEENSKNMNPGAFYNYLKLMLFIEKNPNLFE